MESKPAIVDFLPEHKQKFIEINEAWIKKDYELEEPDIKELHHPEENILRDGGAILIALAGDEVIGTCALVKMDEVTFELVKMAVVESSRGMGLGKMLCERALAKASELGAKKVILHSNTKTAAVAINLYYKIGFQKVPLLSSEWKRADIRMEIDL